MTETVSLTVTGMKCGGCEANVTGKLKEMEGVSSVTASHEKNLVELEFDQAKTSLDAIKQTIADTGYTVE